MLGVALVRGDGWDYWLTMNMNPSRTVEVYIEGGGNHTWGALGWGGYKVTMSSAL